MQVIFAYALQTAFFKDPLTLLGVAGTALIATGVVLVNVDKVVRQRAAAPTAATIAAPVMAAAPAEATAAAAAAAAKPPPQPWER